MDWSRIQTGLLLDRVPERDITAIVKYQLLWAHLEKCPTDEEAIRHITKDQLKRALNYIDSISSMVIPDVRGLVSKRGREKKIYQRNKELNKLPSDGTPDDTNNEQASTPTSQIKEEQNKQEKIKEDVDDMLKNKTEPIKPFKMIPLPEMKF